jgi:hypothetical protein
MGSPGTTNRNERIRVRAADARLAAEQCRMRTR